MRHHRKSTFRKAFSLSLVLIVFLLIWPGNRLLAQSDRGVSVVRMAICENVDNREPQNPDNNFSPATGRIFCFTAIQGINGEGFVFHVWFRDDQEVSRIKLPVHSAFYRTWSAKTIEPGETGKWRVDVLSARGRLLAAEEFLVEQPEKAGSD
ncbi:MAG TPA: DUF2914 domain-containing protein [Calditrichia bacterium]|nr:DUF2914 domain-containing protein [Calditrichia bacterium]